MKVEKPLSGPIKVLSLHWGFHGGVAKYAFLLKRIQEVGRFDIQYVCIRQRQWPLDTPAFSEVDPVEIPVSSRFDVQWFPALVKFLKVYQPQVIITHGYNAHFLAWVTWPFIKNKPVLVCSYHGSYHATTKARRMIGPVFNRFTEFFIRNVASHVVTVCHFCKDFLLKKGIPDRKVTVIHNGIDHLQPNKPVRTAIRAEWNLQDQHVVLGVASRLDPVKGISYLIDAMALLLPKFSHLRLVIVGTGSSECQLKEQVKQLGLTQAVLFVGYRPDISDCLQGFDIFILPSLAEYHSIALLEAMRGEKPIVATDVGGNTESVRHEKEALVVSSHDSQALAQAIERVVMDGDLQQSLAKAAKSRFDSLFVVEHMVEQTTNWFNMIAAKSLEDPPVFPTSKEAFRVPSRDH